MCNEDDFNQEDKATFYVHTMYDTSSKKAASSLWDSQRKRDALVPTSDARSGHQETAPSLQKGVDAPYIQL